MISSLKCRSVAAPTCKLKFLTFGEIDNTFCINSMWGFHLLRMFTLHLLNDIFTVSFLQIFNRITCPPIHFYFVRNRYVFVQVTGHVRRSMSSRTRAITTIINQVQILAARWPCARRHNTYRKQLDAIACIAHRHDCPSVRSPLPILPPNDN